MKALIIVSRRGEDARTLQVCLRQGYRIMATEDVPGALKILQKRRCDCLLIDLDLLDSDEAGASFRSIFHNFWILQPSLEIIVLCRPQQLRHAVMTVREGANTYLTTPIDPEEVKLVLESLFSVKRMESELDYLRKQFWKPDDLEIVQTRCPEMQQVFEKVRSVAPTTSTVLLTGETGTGKGVLARLIHRHSLRGSAPFVSVHCGAIPDTLLESELFGHEKGAFTGADRRKPGRFEIANHGTILLDEIGTVTPSAQIKLLQMLQDKTYHRVGGEETLEVDVRIIAATNADLKRLCEEGRFRWDLFYRLNIFPIEIPPLRARSGDIPLLVQAILKRMNRTLLKEIRGVHPDVTAAFQHYPWPGNIRELENILERACILERETILSPESIPSELLEYLAPVSGSPAEPDIPLAAARKAGVENLERRYLRQLLAKYNGRIKPSAEAAGLSPRRLHILLKKHGIRKEEFKGGARAG